MKNTIFYFLGCILILCVSTSTVGTPEAKETMSSIFSKIWGTSGNIFSLIFDTSIIVLLLAILGISIFTFFVVLRRRKNKKEKFEYYVKAINISFICGISSLLCLMIFTLLGIPDFMTIVYTCIAIFVGVLLILLGRTYIEPNALVCILFLDTLTKEIRVYFKGFSWRSIFAKYQDHIDLKADIINEIEDDFQTKTPGAMFKGKASIICKVFLGKETDPIEEKAKNAIKYIEYKNAIKKEIEIFAKKIMQDFYKSHTIMECSAAKSADIFPPNTFKHLADIYPIKFSEPTVYDSQPDEKTLAQQSKLTDQKNFKTMMMDLMRSKKFGLEKQDAIVMAAFFSGIDWKKTIDQNDYNINFTGLDPKLVEKFTPDTIKAIATAAVAMKGGTVKGKNPAGNSSQNKKKP